MAEQINMDKVDTQQQEEIEALKGVDHQHWEEFLQLGYKALWVQRTFTFVFLWLFILTVGFIWFAFMNIEVKIVPN